MRVVADTSGALSEKVFPVPGVGTISGVGDTATAGIIG